MHGVAVEDVAALMDSPIKLVEPGTALNPDKAFANTTAHPIKRLIANRNPNTDYLFAESGDNYTASIAGQAGW